jgi:ribosomal protein L11 methyltransferase
MKLDSLSYFEISAIPSRREPFSDDQRAALCDFFCECGIPRYEVVFMEGPELVAAAVYTRSLQKRKKIKARFKKVFPKGIRLKERLLVREDWFDKWQTDYSIMPIGKKFVLVPDWKRKEYKPGKQIPIFLDPQGVSGSGQHPTTQIMIELLEKIEGKFKSCLDLGAGTGILGIAAGKLGAESVRATDIDRRAVKAARVNFKLNKTPCASSIYEDVTRNKAVKKYDLVCANLISPVLEVIQKFLFSSVRPGGYLAVSGIHVLNFSKFKSKFRDARFHCLRVVKRRGWTALLFKKTR